MPYEPLQSEPTIQVLGDIIRDAQRVTFRAIPSNVVWSLLFAPWPSDIWTPPNIIEVINEEVTHIDGYLAVPGVTGIAQTQEVDDLNQLVDTYIVSFRSNSGLFHGTANLTAAQINPQTFPQTIAGYVAQLNALESSGVTSGPFSLPAPPQPVDSG